MEQSAVGVKRKEDADIRILRPPSKERKAVSSRNRDRGFKVKRKEGRAEREAERGTGERRRGTAS